MPVTKATKAPKATKATTGKKKKATSTKQTTAATTAAVSANPSTTTATPPTQPPATTAPPSPPPLPSTVEIQLQAMDTRLQLLQTELRALARERKTVLKEYQKERRAWERAMQKHQKKKKASSSNHKSGIAKPGFISPELCSFIGVDVGTQVARTEVIQYIDKYIKEHKLQDKKNRRVIVPDAKLQGLLKCDPKTDEVTYFNLQTFMKPHYAVASA